MKPKSTRCTLRAQTLHVLPHPWRQAFRAQPPMPSKCSLPIPQRAVPVHGAPDPLFEFSYRSTLQAMVDANIEHEAPLREDVLGQRIARAHGWLRRGPASAIRLPIICAAGTDPRGVWRVPLAGRYSSSRVPFRQPLNEAHRRALSDIRLTELNLSSLIRQPLINPLHRWFMHACCRWNASPPHRAKGLKWRSPAH